jgi:hypothetical protein
MKLCIFLLATVSLLAWSTPVMPDEKPEFLAAFDPARDAIQLEFENQVDPACFWQPYQLRDAIAAELEALGLRIAGSSLYVLDVLSWGLETDDFHCAVVLDMKFRRHGVRAEVSPERAVSTELLLWDASDMLHGPKIHLQERLEKKAFEQAANLFEALR